MDQVHPVSLGFGVLKGLGGGELGCRLPAPHPGVPPLHRAAVSVDPFYEMLAARKKRISVKKKQEQP